MTEYALGVFLPIIAYGSWLQPCLRRSSFERKRDLMAIPLNLKFHSPMEELGMSPLIHFDPMGSHLL